MIHVHLQDGATRTLSPSGSGIDLAAVISPILAKRTVAAVVDGHFGVIRAVDVAETPRKAGLRVETEVRNERIGDTVREHALRKVPVQIALGAC